MRSRRKIASRFFISLSYVLTGLLLLVGLAANSSAFQEQAQQKEKSSGDRFKLVEFVDKEFGWAADDHSLWKTENGGRTWTRIRRAGSRKARDTFSGYRQSLNFINRIQLLTRDNGWVLEDSALLHTTDVGVHWKKFAQSELDIRSFRFVNESNGFFVAQRLHHADQPEFSREAKSIGAGIEV